MFRFWLACPVKRCRKARSCLGDQYICLKRGINDVPRRVQFQARQRLMAATPAPAGPPEHAARACMPLALFELARRDPQHAATGFSSPAVAKERRAK